MTANGPSTVWTATVIRYVSANLPRSESEPGWDHTFTIAFEIGCDVLAALGQAQLVECGAIPLANPKVPGILPRWDDICIAVLWLAEQQSKLSYRSQDGSLPPSSSGWVIVRSTTPPAPNIAAAHGLGFAYADLDTLLVLQTLGLIADGAWTAEAETALWRVQPSVWKMGIASDPRFAAAIDRAETAMPTDIRAEIDRLVTITEADMTEAAERSAADSEWAWLEHPGIKTITPPASSPATIEKPVEVQRRAELDWLFYRRWRLADGWLAPDEAKRAIGIFHDPLAEAMRREVMMRLYPDLPSRPWIVA